MISKLSFLGVFPPYKTKKAEIYPLEKDISAKEMNKIVRDIPVNSKYLGKGVNGIAYSIGQDLVVKKSRSDALVNSNLMNEAEKLDILYDFYQEGEKDMENTQKGIAAFRLKNGDSYLISTLVRGNEADYYTNPLNKNNLTSLMKILTELDKGSIKHGRLMVNDLNPGNIMITEDKAGLLDFEHLRGDKLDESIENVIFKQNYSCAPHTSDTSNLNSNVRSFEFAGLHYYLMHMPDAAEAKELFNDYLNIKARYHNEMFHHHLKQAETSKYPDVVKNIALSDKANSLLLSETPVANDILLSEAKKIQMAQFKFVSSFWCNSPEFKFNPDQILKFYFDAKKYFNENLKKAEKSNDTMRIIYYRDCLGRFKKWENIKTLKQTMTDGQKSRITDKYIETLDNKLP